MMTKKFKIGDKVMTPRGLATVIETGTKVRTPYVVRFDKPVMYLGRYTTIVPYYMKDLTF